MERVVDVDITVDIGEGGLGEEEGGDGVPRGTVDATIESVAAAMIGGVDVKRENIAPMDTVVFDAGDSEEGGGVDSEPFHMNKVGLRNEGMAVMDIAKTFGL